MDAVEIGKRVRAARGYAGLSLPDLAEAVEIGRNTLIRTEGGSRQPKRSELDAIARACGLGTAFFDLDFSSPTTPASVEERLGALEEVIRQDLAPLAGLDPVQLERLVDLLDEKQPDRTSRTSTRRRRAR